MTADASGAGVVRFNVPQFNGSLRVVVVAFAGNGFGSVQKHVIVRNPIVLTPTFPRFISGGDRFRVPIGVFNGTGVTGDFEIKLSKTGYVEIMGEHLQTVRLNAEEEGQIFFEVAAHDALGKVTFNLSATGNDKSTQMVTNLTLRPALYRSCHKPATVLWPRGSLWILFFHRITSKERLSLPSCFHRFQR